MTETKRELPELVSTVDGEVYADLGWEDACRKARELTRSQADEVVRRCNNWMMIQDLVRELRSKCEDLPIDESVWWDEIKPVFDELQIELEGE